MLTVGPTYCGREDAGWLRRVCRDRTRGIGWIDKLTGWMQRDGVDTVNDMMDGQTAMMDGWQDLMGHAS